MDASPKLERRTFAYPGGTCHLSSWAFVGAGVFLLWLICSQGGEAAVGSRTRFLSFIGVLVVSPIACGIIWEWSLRNRIGRVAILEEGMECTLPWGRRQLLRWHDIQEVRCVDRRFMRDASFWEVRGRDGQRIAFHWELKNYKELLRIIQARATQATRLDPIE